MLYLHAIVARTKLYSAPRGSTDSCMLQTYGVCEMCVCGVCGWCVWGGGVSWGAGVCGSQCGMGSMPTVAVEVGAKVPHPLRIASIFEILSSLTVQGSWTPEWHPGL